ncbi:unannotated protein [freshwater metagenome]|uniref:Unannotated protein n=1 Tax=freshwater metagenome TaxID=449393 RepID=A0A6J7QDC9_9ZZZZ
MSEVRVTGLPTPRLCAADVVTVIVAVPLVVLILEMAADRVPPPSAQMSREYVGTHAAVLTVPSPGRAS